MCIDPSFVWQKRGPEWVQVPVPCDRCWSCRENYVSDWVGRCLCEASVSKVSCTITLTYAPPPNGELFDKVIQPLHFQYFMKRLRNAGHKVRYLVSGEYGDLKDRAHFHAILFFTHLVPSGKPAPKLENRAAFIADPSIAQPFSLEIPQQEMVHISEWPHGHVEVDWTCTERAIRYCCEYLYEDGKRTAWMSQSKKPPLGWAWFAEKALLSKDYQVFPSTFEYMPPGGKPGKKYLMTGATRREFLNLITSSYKDRPKLSKWARTSFDAYRDRERKEAAQAQPLPPLPEPKAPLTEQGIAALVKKTIDAAERQRQNEHLDVIQDWGFKSVEEYEAFEAAGGYAANPDLEGNPFRPGSGDVPRGEGHKGLTSSRAADQAACADVARRKALKSEPRFFDRQGNPLTRSEKVYRPAWPYENPSQGNLPDPGEGLQEDAAPE